MKNNFRITENRFFNGVFCVTERRSGIRALSFGLLLTLITIGFSTSCLARQSNEATSENSATSQERAGYLIQIPLPVTDDVSARIKQQIERITDEAPGVVAANKRPVLILEFETANGATGQGSELGNCLDIASMLTDARRQKLYTVAYIPRSRGNFSENTNSTDNLPASQLKGHAVLIALACKEIAMHQDSAIGQAGIDIVGDPSLALLNYENIVGLRRPLPFARALVDKSRSLFRVETDKQGFQFKDQDELNDLIAQGKANDLRTLSAAGELPMFTSKAMQELQLIRHRVTSRADLAMRMNVDRNAVDGNPLIGTALNAVQLPINTFVDSRQADWTLRMLNGHLASHPETNLVIVRMNTPGGELDACMRLVRELAALDPGKVQTVAFVESTAGGATSLIAMACDRLIMTRDGRLGGSGVEPISEQQLDDSRPLIKRFAEQKHSPLDWSVPMGLVDPNLTIKSYNNKDGHSRILCEAERLELNEPDQWTPVSELDFSDGVTGTEAARLKLSKSTHDSFDQLRLSYQLEETPIELEPSPTDRWIENIAREIATPWIAAWLLFGAVFLLSTEMSHPGIGVPGFLGTLCLMMFFWSQYLDGNANWLEILLFVVGMFFIILEVFVVPGFGVFGIGGLLMVVVSIVLASQTFIIPRNSEELARLPVSLSLVLAGSCGFFAGVFVIRKFVTTMPMFRRIMLNPPGTDESVSPAQREQRESLVNRSHMVGKTGTTMTPLVPSGKAQIGNELVDVITDGRMIERNKPIRVVEVTGNRVVVEVTES